MTEPLQTVLAVGSYTHPVPHAPNARGTGVELFTVEESTGELKHRDRLAEVGNPAFLHVSPDGRTLFVVSEWFEPVHGTVRAYAMNGFPAPRAMTEQGTGGHIACHITQWGDRLAVSHYGDGRVSFLPIASGAFAEKVDLGPVAEVVQLHGSGPHPERQTGPRAHSCLPHDNGYAYAADFGSDTVTCLAAEDDGSTVKRHITRLKPGSGPRHLAASPDGRFLFTSNELGCTSTSMRVQDDGGLLVIGEAPTLPTTFTGESFCAEIACHPRLPVVYVSNRGHDSITILDVASDGTLHLAGCTQTGGRTPRSFTIDPTGRLLIVANQDSDSLAVFAIDERDGALSFLSQYENVGTPVCVRTWIDPAASAWSSSREGAQT